jgi:small subunit ribosomal protein S1
VKKYKKGDEVEAKILAIDVDKERISLGIKQLSSDYVEEAKDETPKKSDDSSKSAKAKKASNEPENAGTTNLGALLKAKMDNSSDKESKE